MILQLLATAARQRYLITTQLHFLQYKTDSIVFAAPVLTRRTICKSGAKHQVTTSRRMGSYKTQNVST
jgi:hypothetical protein